MLNYIQMGDPNETYIYQGVQEKACKLVLKDGIKHAMVAEKLEINKVMLYRWIDEYETYGQDTFVGKGRLRPEEAKLRELQKEN